MKTAAYCCSSPQLLWVCDSSAATGHVSLTVVTSVSQPSVSLVFGDFPIRHILELCGFLCGKSPCRSSSTSGKGKADLQGPP